MKSTSSNLGSSYRPVARESDAIESWKVEFIDIVLGPEILLAPDAIASGKRWYDTVLDRCQQRYPGAKLLRWAVTAVDAANTYIEAVVLAPACPPSER